MLRIQYERITRHLSQATLAQLSGLRQPDICLVEQGRLLPTRDQLVRLARALGIDPPEALLLPVLVQQPDAEKVDA